MRAYRQPASGQRIFDREIGQLLALGAKVPCVPLLADVIGPEQAARWSRAIRSVTLGEVERHRVVFAPDVLHPPDTVHERRFHALLLIIGAEVRPLARGAGLRAFTKNLWRGRSQREYVDADGELKRAYVPALGADGKSGHQGGLAARLGCSVRTVELYLRVAKAAGFIAVHQVKKKASVDKLPGHLRGKRYSYAVFDWLVELPRAVMDRLRGRVSRDSAESAPPELPSAPPRRESQSADLFTARLEQWEREPPRRPS